MFSLYSFLYRKLDTGWKVSPQTCVFYRTKIHGTVLKESIRIEYLIKQKSRGGLAEKQVPTEQLQNRRVA